MWQRRVHLFKSLIDQNEAKTFIWTENMNIALKETKALMLTHCLMRSPNQNLSVDIYTDASDYQMGAYILENSIPVVYWSRN